MEFAEGFAANFKLSLGTGGAWGHILKIKHSKVFGWGGAAPPAAWMSDAETLVSLLLSFFAEDIW